MSRRWLAVLLLVGCQEDATICGDLRCPTGKVCSPDGMSCVLQAQLDACRGNLDGTACSFPATPNGVCGGEVCVAAGCGNRVVEPGEACDDGNRLSFDGCRADCLSRERCGDGIAEPALGEYCDCGEATASPTCIGPNSSAPGADCRLDCRLSRCGDAIVDPSELCDDGNTAYFDGCRGDCAGRFRKMQLPSVVELKDVWTSGPTEAVAVGLDATLLHFDGTSWSKIASTSTSGFMQVWASGANDVYIATLDNALIHYDGTNWTSPFSGAINGIWGSGPNDVYVLDGNNLRHFTGTWSIEPACGHTGLSAIWGASSSAVFVASAQGICRYNGSMWSPIDATASRLIAGTSATDVYSLTPSEVLRHWNGTSWTPLPTPPAYLIAMAAAGPEDLLAVTGSGGVILQLDGTTWTSLASPTENLLNAISASSPTNVIIVGGFGTLLH